MKKLVLLLSVVVLLVIATGAVSAAKPAPEQFTITGYTINNPLTDYEVLSSGNYLFHVLAQGGGERKAGDEFCAALSQDVYDTCDELCEQNTGHACGVSDAFRGRFSFEEWIEVAPEQIDFETGTFSGIATNTGVITITTPATSNAGSIAVVRFDGKADSDRVWGEFEVDEQEGKGVYKHLDGGGDYDGNTGLVFSVTFTFKR